MMHLERTAEVDAVQGPHGQDCGKGAGHAARQFKPGRFEDSFAEAAPHVVEVAPHDDRRLPLGIVDQTMFEKLAELEHSLGASQTQVNVRHDQRPRVFADGNFAAGEQRLPPLLEADRQVVALDLGERKPAENRIAVPTLLQSHVALKRKMSKAKSRCEQFRLEIVPRAGYSFVDFLQERDVGLHVGQRFDNPLRLVTTVAPADAFVDVVSDESQMHVIPLTLPGISAA